MQSNEIKQLMAALSKAHIHHPSGVIIPKESKGNRATYANLPTVMRFIHEMCHPNGLVFTQGSLVVGGVPSIFSKLTHIATGEYISCASLLTVAANPQSPDQAWGGSTTYHRRYDAMMLLGLFAEDDPEDDDGYRNANKVETKTQYISQDQVSTLKALFDTHPELLNKFLAVAKLDSYTKLPADYFNSSMGWINRNITK